MKCASRSQLLLLSIRSLPDIERSRWDILAFVKNYAIPVDAMQPTPAPTEISRDARVSREYYIVLQQLANVDGLSLSVIPMYKKGSWHEVSAPVS
jgi:hypothetical protein